jgi:hypothetical protein
MMSDQNTKQVIFPYQGAWEGDFSPVYKTQILRVTPDWKSKIRNQKSEIVLRDVTR